MISVGFVGGGSIARLHLRALLSVRGVEVAGLASRTAPTELADWVQANSLGPGVVYSSVEELAAAVDVVALFSPNTTRIPLMEAMARASSDGAGLRAVVSEKPLARNVFEARRMVALAEEMGITTAYFENQVHMPGLRAAQTQLAPSIAKTGPLSLARAAEEHGGPHSAWFWDPVQQGGGVLSDMGCHSLAVGWYLLTPPERGAAYLRPVRVSAQVGLLKWGRPEWRQNLLDRFGVDFEKTPAEDFATGIVTFRDPETGFQSMAQFTVSWMYDNQGLRLLIDGLGPGYALEMNSLRSPLEAFVGSSAASVCDPELALEKATSTQGLLSIQANEPDLYGFVNEWRDLVEALESGRPPLLDWSYGLEIVRLTMASYLSAEEGRSVDLEDPATLARLESYVPLIQEGRGREVLHLPD